MPVCARVNVATEGTEPTSLFMDDVLTVATMDAVLDTSYVIILLRGFITVGMTFVSHYLNTLKSRRDAL